MEATRPRLRETAITEKFETTNLKWHRLMMRVCAMLGGRKCRKCMEKLYIEVRHTLKAGTGFKDYLVKWFTDYMEILARKMTRDLSVTKKKSRKQILVVYHERSQTFIRTLRFFAAIERTMGSDLIVSYYGCVCLGFWVELVIQNDVLLPRMAKVLTQRILERNVDLNQLKYVYRTLQSLRVLGDSHREKFLQEMEIILEEQLEETMLTLLKNKLAKSPCVESITKIARWEENIREAIDVLKLSDDFKLSMMDVFTMLADVFFKKAAEEMAPKYKQFEADHTSHPIPIRFHTQESDIGAIWEPMSSDNTKLPEALLEMRMYCISIGLFCGPILPWSRKWITQVSSRIRSEIITFPTDPAQRITDSRAYIDFYYDAWNSHCKYVAFYHILSSRLLDYMEYCRFLEICFQAWAQKVVEVERENLYNHLITLLRQCLNNPGVEVDDKVVGVIYSFRFLRTSDRKQFQNYFLNHVMKPYTDKASSEFEEKFKTQSCVLEVLQELNRVADFCQKLPLSKEVTGFFNQHIGQLLFKFLCTQLDHHVMRGKFDIVNKIAILGDRCDKLALDGFYSEVSMLCEKRARSEIAATRETFGKAEGFLPLAGSILSASFQFDTFLMQPLDYKLRSAMMEGFRSAVNLEAISHGSSALKLVTEYLLPAMGVLPGPRSQVNNCIRTMLHIGRIFKYVCHTDRFSRLFMDSLATRILSARNFLCHAEFFLHRLVHKLFEPEYQKIYWQQMIDLTVSHRRMQHFPSVFGFERTNPVSPSATDEEKIQKAVQAMRPYRNRVVESCEGPEDTVTFEGIEFNIRVLRGEAWPISNINGAFTPPPILQRIMDSFAMIYHKVDGEARKLTWIHHATGIIMLWRFTSDQRVYEVQCDSFVASVMLMFEDIDEIAPEVIKRKTNISENILGKILAGLLKLKVLVCKANGQTEETFALNPDFQATEERIFIGCKNKGACEPNSASCQERDKSGRDSNCAAVIHAAMLRVAKRNQTISKKDLLEQTIWELRTLTCETPSLLMNALDYLVQQKYLEYDKSSRLFIYLP